MALIQINRDVSDPTGTLQPGELWLNLTNGRLWGGTSGGNALLLDPTGGTGPFLPLVGGTITGPLVLPGNATAPLQAMPLQQLDTAQHNIGRNLLHNPLFNVAQRGVGPFTTLLAYTLDRWLLNGTTDTVSIGSFPLTDADRAQIGDEAASFCLQNGFTGSAAPAAANNLVQRIENSRRLAGKTVTVSFWAKAVSGTPKLGVNMTQNFGTGGSPSPSVNALATGYVAQLSNVWTRFSTTIAIPSASGKTFGTNNDSQTGVQFWFSSGANSAAQAGNIGVQSGTVQLWGVQLEIGSVATPLEKPDPRYDLANCQRFYRASNIPLQIGFNSWGAGAFQFFPMYHPVSMRATPTIVIGSQSGLTNVSSANVNINQPDGFLLQAIATTTGGASATYAGFTASADL